jgi:hypothetical protein
MITRTEELSQTDAEPEPKSNSARLTESVFTTTVVVLATLAPFMTVPVTVIVTAVILVVPCAAPEPADCVHASEVAKPSVGSTGAALVGGGAPCCTSPLSAALAKKLASFAVPGPSAAGLSADPARSALLGWYTAPVTVPAVFGNGEFTVRTVMVPLFTADRTGAGRFPHVTVIPVRLDTAGKLATYSFTAAGELTGVELGLKSPTRAEPRSTTAQLKENQA